MTIEQEKNSELTLDLDEQKEESLFYKIATKKPKRGFLLGVIALLIGGTLFWRSLANKEQQAVETTNNIEQARLTVKTADAEVEPIQAWSYGDGYVSAVVKKHLNFQAEGTIDYIKKIEGRDLREGDRVAKGELLAKLDPRKTEADLTVAQSGQTEAQNKVADAVANLRQAEAGLSQAEADLEKAKTDTAFAAADLKRYQELVAAGAVERREVDVKQTEYKNAQAIEAATQAAVNSAQSKIAVGTRGDEFRQNSSGRVAADIMCERT